MRASQGDLDDRKKILKAEIRKEMELEMQRELLPKL
jgi:hypothetical protein